MAKVALLIGVSEYESPHLNPLPAATQDVEGMQRVLQDQEIGGFDVVKTLINPDPGAMQEAIESLFSNRQKNDLVLLYFSGHGIRDDSGRLYFATRITRKNEQGELVKASTVSADFLHDIINDSRSRSKRQVIILDCCFSGAFAKNIKGKDEVYLDFEKIQLGGEGRAVLTSSTSTQYSFESIYTHYLVQGIETGEADENNDGFISVDELHQYVQRKVQENKPEMKPQIQAVIKEGYNIVLAKAPIHNRESIYLGIVKSWVHNGQISDIGRLALNEQQNRLEIERLQATVIEEEGLKPYKEYQRKLQQYKEAFHKAIQRENPIIEQTRQELKRLQQNLGLRDEDTAIIEARAKRRLNPTPKSIGLLTIGVIIGAITGWFLKPNIKPQYQVISCSKPEVTNQFADKTDTFAEVHNVPSGTFKYGGSTSWAFLYPKLESEIKNTCPLFDIKIRNDLVQGSGVGIQKLIDGGQDGLDFALSSRDVSSEEEDKAKRKLFTLKAIPVAKSGLAVAVNPNLAINALTKEQLSKIFSGKIDNWKQAGALVDIPIKFYVRGSNLTSTNEFRKSLGIIDFGRNINYVISTTEGLQKIAREPGGIFTGPISDIVPQCGVKTLPIVNTEGKTIYPYQQQNFISHAQCRPGKRNRINMEAIYSRKYPLPVIFYVVVKQNGQREEQAGQAYANLLLTKQGQEMIKSLQETGTLDENN